MPAARRLTIASINVNGLRAGLAGMNSNEGKADVSLRTDRAMLVRSVLEGLRHDGCLILVEKVLGEDSHFNRLFIKHYYEIGRAHV